jgi:hypothetical protein
MASWRRRADGVPARLVSFRLTEWPDASCPHEAIRQWQDACLGWLAEDSNREPRPDAGVAWLAGDSNRTLPFGEYGDGLDVLREALRLRHSFPPCPEEGRPAQRTANGVRHA